MRPISLTPFSSKILSKILNDRLSVVLPSIISLEQAGFVQGRSIHESICPAHELLADIKKKTYGGYDED